MMKFLQYFRGKKAWSKGELSKTIVLFNILVLTIVLFWAMCVKTYSIITETTTDLSDILTFAGAAFGGELGLLAAKRIFAKPNKTTGGTDYEQN